MAAGLISNPAFSDFVVRHYDILDALSAITGSPRIPLAAQQTRTGARTAHIGTYGRSHCRICVAGHTTVSERSQPNSRETPAGSTATRRMQ
jgi:hypothetical protein